MSYRTGPGVPRTLTEVWQFVRREFMSIERLYTRVEKEAGDAQGTADGAQTTADAAQASANAAQASADAAQSSADAAQSSADSAQSSANSALSSASTAQSAAETAQSAAATAQSAANAAQADATTALNPYANLLRNPTAERGLTFWAAPSIVSAYNGENGEGSFFAFGSTNNQTEILLSDWFRLSEYVQLTLSLEMHAAGITAGTINADFEFADVNYNNTGGSNRATAVSGTGWTRYQATQTSPAGTYRCRVRVFLEGATGTGAFARRIMVNSGPKASPYTDTLAAERDQRNLPMVQADIASVPSGQVCTAADVGSSTTITIAAHTQQFGFGTVSYNAGSIAGLQFNKLYHIYCDDPDYAGGSVTYYATTSLATAKGGPWRRHVDSVTTPSDGGSSTGGFNPDDCVASGMWLLDGLLVDDAQAGDLIDVWDIGDVDSAKGPIDAIRPAHNVECVRITMESGAEVVCSVSTPVTGPDGEVRYAPDALGMQLGVLHDNEPLVWERVVSVEPVGTRTVYHLSCGNISFAAGTDPAHRVVTHNLYYKN